MHGLIYEPQFHVRTDPGSPKHACDILKLFFKYRIASTKIVEEEQTYSMEQVLQTKLLPITRYFLKKEASDRLEERQDGGLIHLKICCIVCPY